MSSIRQELWRTMTRLLRIETRFRNCWTTRCGYSKNRAKNRTDKNHTFRVPCSASNAWNIREHTNVLSVEIDSFQFAVAEECDRLVIRRPEWRCAAFGSWQRTRCAGIERSEPQLRPAL